MPPKRTVSSAPSCVAVLARLPEKQASPPLLSAAALRILYGRHPRVLERALARNQFADEIGLESIRLLKRADQMPNGRKYRTIPKYAVLSSAAILSIVVSIGILSVIQDRNDGIVSEEIARTGAELQVMSAQIAGIKDADLKSMNDFIGAYAQIGPITIACITSCPGDGSSLRAATSR